MLFDPICSTIWRNTFSLVVSVGICINFHYFIWGNNSIRMQIVISYFSYDFINVILFIIWSLNNFITHINNFRRLIRISLVIIVYHFRWDLTFINCIHNSANSWYSCWLHTSFFGLHKFCHIFSFSLYF